jgi:hypothetical protein
VGPVVAPLDPLVPPAPLVLVDVVGPLVVGPLVVDEVLPCPEPELEVELVSEPVPVDPVLVVAPEFVPEPELSHVSTFGSHLAAPCSAQPTNAVAPAETMNPKPKEMRNRKLRGMCILSPSCPGRRALATPPTHGPLVLLAAAFRPGCGFPRGQQSLSCGVPGFAMPRRCA